MHPVALPNSTIAKMDSIFSNFFWNGKDNKRKMNWIAWKNICKPKSIGGLGCLSNKNMNLISLARLCWKLDNGTMWASKIIHEKYVNNKEYPTIFKRRSHIWNNIGIGWDLYKNSIAWKVGNGETINLWQDKWLFGENLRSLVEGPLLPHERDLRLGFIRNNDILNISSLDLPPKVLNKVRATTFTSNSDKTFFLWSKHNSFSSKAALEFIFGFPNDGSWDWIWKCPGHPKSRFFIWQSWWGRMPSNANINSRIPSFSKHSTFCPNSTEDMNHILKICPRSSKVWDALKINIILPCSFHVWLRSNLTASGISSHVQVPANVIFLFCIMVHLD